MRQWLKDKLDELSELLKLWASKLLKYVLILLAGALGACAIPPPIISGIMYSHRMEIIWHEVKPERLAAICSEVLSSRERDEPLTQGCHYWDGKVTHIYTPIVRNERGLCGLGHEVAHHPEALGRFHDRDGTWRLER